MDGTLWKNLLGLFGDVDGSDIVLFIIYFNTYLIIYIIQYQI